jgi:hypothetical protein
MKNIKFLNISKNYRKVNPDLNDLNKKYNLKIKSYEDSLNIAMKALNEL